MNGRERGSTIPLIVFACALGLTLIWVVTAATSLYIARKQLFSVADGAALAASDAIDLHALSLDPTGNVRVQLDERAVRETAEHFVATAPTPLHGLRLNSATSPDSQSARVVVSAQWSPPILGEFLPAQLSIEVTATARTAFAG